MKYKLYEEIELNKLQNDETDFPLFIKLGNKHICRLPHDCEKQALICLNALNEATQ